MVQWVKPTEQMIKSIALDMRQADIDEVWASNHHTPLDALMEGWKVSDVSLIALCDDEPVLMLGLVKRDLLTGTGVVWLLGANKGLKYKRELLRQGKLIIDEMLTICPRLCNMVHNKNVVSIRWLKYSGFIIDDPAPHGPDNELFHQFHLEGLR